MVFIRSNTQEFNGKMMKIMRLSRGISNKSNSCMALGSSTTELASRSVSPPLRTDNFVIDLSLNLIMVSRHSSFTKLYEEIPVAYPSDCSQVGSTLLLMGNLA